jgi:hypothetical protein
MMKGDSYFVCGFACFGLLLGFVVGLSSAPITEALVAALFAFIGGKMFLDFEKKDSAYRRIAGGILISFSICCLLGLIAGVVIKTHQSLGTRRTPHRGDSDSTQTIHEYDYLKHSKPKSDNIFNRYRESGSRNADSLLDVLENEYNSGTLIFR